VMHMSGTSPQGLQLALQRSTAGTCHASELLDSALARVAPTRPPVGVRSSRLAAVHNG
jgi:hypothetical protein